MDKALMIFHNGIIGVDFNEQVFVAGKYKDATVREDALKAALKLQLSEDVEFSVPNRVIRIFTENNIKSKVHSAEEIKKYMRVFDFIEKYQTKQIKMQQSKRKTYRN